MGDFASLRALKKPEKQQLGSGTDRQMMNKGRKLPSRVILPVSRQILLLFPPFTLVENSQTRRVVRCVSVCALRGCCGSRLVPIKSRTVNGVEQGEVV